MIQKSLNLYDKTRNRAIPLEIYVGQAYLKKATHAHRLSVAMINHGSTVSNKEYSFIANYLANSGYYVISIQHDLKGDPKLPVTGNIFQRRRPLWDRGLKNILFVMNHFKKYSQLDLGKLVLIGHSNGGDITMLLASFHPEYLYKVVSLDSLRMPFPDNAVKILSIRADDTKPDDGVLSKNAKIISIKAKHIDLCDRGTTEIKQEVLNMISVFLQK